MTTIQVELDSRVHNRIIGGRGAQVRKIMEQFKVDVRFPRASDENKDLVEITGDEDDCYDCRDELLNLEEEYVSHPPSIHLSYPAPVFHFSNISHCSSYQTLVFQTLRYLEEESCIS